MVTIRNQSLTVTISEQGAELQSILGADGHEYLWHGDPKWYHGRAPVLFPICGRLPNGQYTLDGNTYEMGAHGFARRSTFEVESATETAATFLLRDNETTRAMYPFAFEFRVIFALCDATLSVTYDIHNPADTPLFASFGAHEGYHCPEGLPEYDLILPEKCTLDTYLINAETGNITNNKKRVFDNNDTLALTYDLFAVDALVFKHPNLSSVALRHRQTGRTVTVAFENADNLLVWTVPNMPNSPFVCIEPWWGIGHCENGTTAFLEKPDLHRVEGGDTLSVTHSITVGI